MVNATLYQTSLFILTHCYHVCFNSMWEMWLLPLLWSYLLLRTSLTFLITKTFAYPKFLSSKLYCIWCLFVYYVTAGWSHVYIVCFMQNKWENTNYSSHLFKVYNCMTPKIHNVWWGWWWGYFLYDIYI